MESLEHTHPVWQQEKWAGTPQAHNTGGSPSQEPGWLWGCPKVGWWEEREGQPFPADYSHPGPGASPQGSPEDQPAGWRARLKPVEKSPADRCVHRPPGRRASPACGQGGHRAGTQQALLTGQPHGGQLAPMAGLCALGLCGSAVEAGA